MTQEIYHFTNIRNLLTQGFKDQELRNLCFDIPDFRSVYEDIGEGTSKAVIVSKLLEHAAKTLQVDILLALARELNPARYEQHQPYYLTDPTFALQKKLAGLARQSSASANKTSSTLPIEMKPQQQISFLSWLRNKWTIALLAGVTVIAGLILLSSFWKSWTSDSADFPIEKAPVSAGLYEGADDPQTGKGTGYLEVTSSISNEQFATSYKLDYSIPKDGDAYAGIYLWFSEPQDLTGYNFIELTISFRDDQARCKLFIKDAFGGYGSVTLGDGDIVSAKKGEQTIKIPLQLFTSLSRKFVNKLDFDVNGNFVRGDNSFTISKIRFLK